ncbi:FAD-dependent oxidoreductase [Hyphococcus flavus]|uniref:Pyridine nucleotide-disulfide oxidoreductase domain-containing protein 2 n=1 Tax=Hyphococcus flavus TaxID=1866326 RepID=A0AAE9ZCD2_9PROT|nr:FAD-dependent oxidoreductase [Hyphococcus flavus]WDI32134.1 FAD-dependent oxidoreductase [Hyphococcus flavus]
MQNSANNQSAQPEQSQQTGRIEGGIDAIVIGGSADGLAAAAYLGKAGLHTVLVGAGKELGGRIVSREIAGGIEIVDGEHLVTQLDPDVIADLDLYRHGLSFAARRLDTTYFFSDADALKLDGDLSKSALLSLEDDDDAAALETFIKETLELAHFLRPAFKTVHHADGGLARKALDKLLSSAPRDKAELIEFYLFSAATDVISSRFADGPLKSLLLSEAVFRSGVAPHEPFSFMPYLRKLSGEAAGLQGAVAYPAGGAVAVVTALRRAAQLAKVDMRAATPVRSILIEGDRVAGVMLENGGQLRAPVVIAACDAARAFLKMIGPGKIDIGLQRILAAHRPEFSTGRLHCVLKGVAQDDATRDNLKRRLFYAPSVEEVSEAFLEARAGRVPEKLIIEAIFPGSLDEEAELEGRQVMSVMAHPLPFDVNPDETRREEIRKQILVNIEIFAEGLSDRVEVCDLRLPSDEAVMLGAEASAFAAKSNVMSQWALAAATAQSGRITGFYFCGGEAQIGAGLCCSAARGAAKAALRAYRKGVA